ncbi:MAG: hypothetical protein QG608_1336 [Actinomycetota bacterium]|nr:hypothetical protein [Actinomycetota bacterium]
MNTDGRPTRFARVSDEGAGRRRAGTETTGPGRSAGLARLLDRVRPRNLRHSRGPALVEALVVVLVSTAVTVLTNGPVVRGLSTTVPGNLGDPLYFAWQMSWVEHAVRTDPGGLWTTTAFQQAPDNLAYTDTILGYLPLSWIARLLYGDGQAGALAALNLAGLFATVCAACGAYALARALGSSIAGASVAGAGFAFAPWRLEQAIHVNVESTGGLALTLAALVYGHGWSLRHGWRPDRVRGGWILTGWLVACWQLTLGFAIAIPFGYALGLVMGPLLIGWAVSGRRRLPRPPRGALIAEVAGMLAFCGLLLAYTRPFLRVQERFPEVERTVAHLELFSPPPRGLFTPPATNHFWGERLASWRVGLGWELEMVLLPGFLLLGLAALGLALSRWPLRRRLGLGAVVVVTAVLALGTNAPGDGRWTYLPLFDYAPGWNAMRVPGRLIIWTTLALCLLAAGAVDAAARALVRWVASRTVAPLGAPSAPGENGENGEVGEPGEAGVSGGTGETGEGGENRTTAWGSLPAAARWGIVGLLVLPAACIVTEGRGDVPSWAVQPAPVKVSDLSAPVLFLPSDPMADYHLMLWTTDGFPVTANGYSGFDPPAQVNTRFMAQTFPDAVSVDWLRGKGVSTVVVVRSRSAGTPFEKAADRDVTGLGIERTDRGDAVVFDLR